MKTTKITTNKASVHATTKYLTNGHWAFRRDFFQRFFKTDNQKINAALDLKQNFTYDDEFMDCRVEESRIEALFEGKSTIPLESFGLYLRDGNNMVKIFNLGSEVIAINADYADPLFLSEAGHQVTLTGTNSGSRVQIYVGDELVGILMPTRSTASAAINSAASRIQTSQEKAA